MVLLSTVSSLFPDQSTLKQVAAEVRNNPHTIKRFRYTWFLQSIQGEKACVPKCSDPHSNYCIK